MLKQFRLVDGVLITACIAVANEISRTDPTQLEMYNGTLIQSAAVSFCSSRGGQLPLPDTDLEQRTLLQEMKRKGLTSIWLRGKRHELNQWTWIDGTPYGDEKMYAAESHQCAFYDQYSMTINSTQCSNSLGHLCESKECNDCSGYGWFRQICKTFDNSCFFFHCDERSWYNARAACAESSPTWDLAMLKRKFLLVNLSSVNFNCFRFWVGLRRQQWISKGGESSPLSSWDTGQPSAGDCMRLISVDGRPKWVSSFCQEKAHAMCIPNKIETIPSNTALYMDTESVTTDFRETPSNTTTGSSKLVIIVSIVACLLGLLLTIGVFIIYMVLKKRGSQRDHVDTFEMEQLTRGEEGQLEPTEDLPASTSMAVGQTIQVAVGARRGFKKLRKRIAENIIRNYGIISKWDWENPELTFIDKIYTNMSWMMKPRGKIEEVSFPDMFARSKDSELLKKLILITGEAGTGKTTLMKRLLVDWSYAAKSGFFGRNKRLLKITFDVLKNFKFVIPIFLANVKKGQTLVEILCQQLSLNAPDASEFHNYIYAHQDKCVFILDGFDEFKKETSKDAFRLANREYLKDSTIIITCRTPASFHLRHLDNSLNPDITYELKGFSDSHVKEYISKYLCDPTKIETILNYIKGADLREIVRFPAMICLFCSLFETDRGHSHTFTGIYRDVVLHACSRYQSKYMMSKDKVSKDRLLDIFKDELVEIGKLAITGIADQCIQLSFPVSEVIERLSDSALKLGLLVHNDSIVSFLHASFQEYFIAFLICNSDENERENLMETIYKSNAFPHHAGRILRFIAGLSGEDIRSEIEQALDTLIREKSDFLINYMLEHKDIPFPLPPHIHLDISQSTDLKVIRSFLSLDSSRVALIKISTDTLGHAEILREGTLQNLIFLEIHGLKTLGFPVQSQSYSVQSGTTLDKSHHVKPNLEILSRVVPFPYLRRLTITNLDDRDDALFPHLCKQLKLACNLKQLNLQGCRLSEEGMDIFWVSLEKLLLLQCLRCPQNAKCYVRTDYMKKIGALKNLEIFQTPPLFFDNSQFSVFVEHLESLPAIRELILVDCGCSSEKVWTEFAKNLKALKGIEYIDISRNNLGKDFLREIKETAAKWTDLRVLRLENCNLEDSSSVLEILKVCENIQDLSLADNEFSDGLKDLSAIKDRVSGMKSLKLTGNNLGSETVTILTKNEHRFSSKIKY